MKKLLLLLIPIILLGWGFPWGTKYSFMETEFDSMLIRKVKAETTQTTVNIVTSFNFATPSPCGTVQLTSRHIQYMDSIWPCSNTYSSLGSPIYKWNTGYINDVYAGQRFYLGDTAIRGIRVDSAGTLDSFKYWWPKDNDYWKLRFFEVRKTKASVVSQGGLFIRMPCVSSNVGIMSVIDSPRTSGIGVIGVGWNGVVGRGRYGGVCGWAPKAGMWGTADSVFGGWFECGQHFSSTPFTSMNPGKNNVGVYATASRFGLWAVGDSGTAIVAEGLNNAETLAVFRKGTTTSNSGSQRAFIDSSGGYTILGTGQFTVGGGYVGQRRWRLGNGDTLEVFSPNGSNSLRLSCDNDTLRFLASGTGGFNFQGGRIVLPANDILIGNNSAVRFRNTSGTSLTILTVTNGNMTRLGAFSGQNMEMMAGLNGGSWWVTGYTGTCVGDTPIIARDTSKVVNVFNGIPIQTLNLETRTESLICGAAISSRSVADTFIGYFKGTGNFGGMRAVSIVESLEVFGLGRCQTDSALGSGILGGRRDSLGQSGDGNIYTWIVGGESLFVRGTSSFKRNFMAAGLKNRVNQTYDATWIGGRYNDLDGNVTGVGMVGLGGLNDSVKATGLTEGFYGLLLSGRANVLASEGKYNIVGGVRARMTGAPNDSANFAFNAQLDSTAWSFAVNSRLRSSTADSTVSFGKQLWILNGNDTTIVRANAVLTDTIGCRQINYGEDAGVDDDYAITLPGINAYSTGMPVWFSVTVANTGAATLSVNGLAAKALKVMHDQDPVDNYWEAGSIIHAVYDGTNFQVMQPDANP